VLALLLFPRVWALLVALLLRLLSKAVLSFAAHFVSELYTQLSFGAAEVEQQLVEWLHWQLGWSPPTATSAPPAYLTNGPLEPTAPAPPAPGPPNPTRPVDIVMIILLGLQLRRQQPLVGGVGKPEARSFTEPVLHL